MTAGDFPVPEWPGKVAGDPGHERIAAFLTMDIQRATRWADEVLLHVTRVRQGLEGSWEMAMNAYMLNVGPKNTDIIPVYEETGEETVSVSTEEVRAALEAWSAQITKQSD